MLRPLLLRLLWRLEHQRRDSEKLWWLWRDVTKKRRLEAAQLLAPDEHLCQVFLGSLTVTYLMDHVSFCLLTGFWFLIGQPEPRCSSAQRPSDVASSGSTDHKEYCELDVFRARCDADEVILITEAKYGVVKLGRCVHTDYGYVGCYADVLDYLNSKCAGRRHCEQRQPDPFLSDAVLSRTNCPKEFKAFLYVDYKCVKDEKRSCRTCSRSGGQAKLTSPSGYIPSIVSAETQSDGSCGSTRCPWVIVAQPGQVINITLLDYNQTLPRQKQGSSGENCVRYAVVKERANPKDTALCGGGKKEGLTYTSVSNVVEVQVVSQDVFNWRHQFLIRYEAIGCADMTPPKLASLTRVDDRLEIDCPPTGDRWQLTCVGNSWQGHMGPCGSDQPAPMGAVGILRQTASSFLAVVPFGVLMAGVVAVLIIITVLIATVGVVCYKKQQYKRRHRRSMAAPTTQFIEFRDDLPVSEGALLQKGAVVPTLVIKSGAVDGRENKYAANSRKMDARPLPSIPDLRSGSWKMVAADPGSMAALHRINSGHRQSRMIIRSCGPDGFRRSSAGPRPGSTCTVYSQTDPHQYFVLEPEEPTGTGRDIREMILLQERQTIPRAHFHPNASVDSMNDSLENVGGVGIGYGGNLMITSVHEIPMRSPQSQLALTQGVSTGPSGGRAT